MISEPVYLEIGGGTAPSSGYLQLDRTHGIGTLRRDVQDGIPLRDCSVRSVRASHVLEHIPSGVPRIDTFNEIHRVLEPGGTFELIVPLVGYTLNGLQVPVGRWEPYADPTHLSFWWFPHSLAYFCANGITPSADYGISLWKELQADDWRVSGGWEGFAVLHKPGYAARDNVPYATA